MAWRAGVPEEIPPALSKLAHSGQLSLSGSTEQCLISLHGDRGILTPSHSLEGKHFITGLLAGKVRLTWTASLLEFSIKLFTQSLNKPTDLCRKSAGRRSHLFSCKRSHFSRDPSSLKCDPWR